MSTAPLVPDPDLSRLLDDGYDVVVQAGHLIVRHVPYVTETRTVEYGRLAYPVTVSGDRVVSATDHRIWFVGSAPCDEHGHRLPMVNAEKRPIAEGVEADFMLSSKPADGYPDQYTKVTAYVRMIAHQAQAIDPTVTPTPGAAWQSVDDDSPFAYRDTATSRAGLAAVNRRYRGHRIVIVGLGGTGTYILDQVAKTEVDAIAVVDGDVFDNHNAFRAPGAATIETLRSRPNKAAYFASVYVSMHPGVTAREEYLDEDNLDDVLGGATFVFLACDDAVGKPVIMDWLEAHSVPFIDVGMGIEETDGRLGGLLRVTTSLPGAREKARERIPVPAPERDDYDRNIQTADLNALNAMLAVIRWKRHLGIYADATGEGFATYSLITNEISNEDRL